MTIKLTALILTFAVSSILSWEALPQIPTGRRTQFLVLHENGGYKYGYDTGDGSAAKQSGDAANQVAGHYFYKNAAGQNVDLKYTAGVQGFVPENLDQLLAKSGTGPASVVPSTQYLPALPAPSTQYLPAPISQYTASSESLDNDDQAGTGDASYSFNIDTDTYKRQEVADARGNVKGSYSYSNGAGTHDLTYIAGENTGFVATSGTLSKANGLKEGQQSTGYSYQTPSKYSYSPSSGYSYPDPLGYTYPAPVLSNSIQSQGAVNADGSYSFAYSTADSSRQESADAANNVKGRYAYSNDAGQHDLSYVAGAQTGFQVTGGSLAVPNGLGNAAPVAPALSYSAPSLPSAVSSLDSSAVSANVDGSYSFGYNTGDSSRQESSDSNGNVVGSYSYRNSAGNHDLSYVAGSATGFLPTGGSLSVPNGVSGAGSSSSRLTVPTAVTSYNAQADSDDQSNTGDASYSFSIDTDEYKRRESSDASGNVKGSFSYKNEAGTHDLSFVAGSATGFLPTGGSLSDPNAITAKIAAIPAKISSIPSLAVKNSIEDSSDDQANTGDASYSFTIDTADYKRQESSDASGNVKGSYSYSNLAGNHDLSFVAGSDTGFLPTGGSLKTPPGLSEVQLRSSVPQIQAQFAQFKSAAPLLPNSLAPSSKSSYTLGNVAVHTYLPPSNEKHKFGYILDTV